MSVAGVSIQTASLVEHHQPLTSELTTARGTWRDRGGLVLKLTAEDGTTGLGEASPLPGYSSDSLDACRAALAAIDWRRDPFTPPPLPAAARFAFDTALLDLRARQLHRPAWSLLADRVPGRVPLCAVISERDPARIEEHLRHRLERGFASFKLKIGGDPAQDLIRCEMVRRVAPLAEIRVDANQGFSKREVVERLRPYRDLGCSFVEEPLRDLNLVGGSAELIAICEALPLPIAIDESLKCPGAEAGVRALLGRVPIGALVLKPMMLGGIDPVRRWADVAAAHHVPVVLSHLFDGPTALGACATLALVFGTQDVPAGLAPHVGLDGWPAPPVRCIERNWIHRWESPGLPYEP